MAKKIMIFTTKELLSNASDFHMAHLSLDGEVPLITLTLSAIIVKNAVA